MNLQNLIDLKKNGEPLPDKHLKSLIKSFVQNNIDDNSIKKNCLKENMITLRRDGVNKILYGFTTVEEILSITSA